MFFRTSKNFGRNPIEHVTAQTTLLSLLSSFSSDEIIVICDNTKESQYLWFASKMPYVYRTYLGNSGSFRLSINLTSLHPADIYYFVEDDHLHLPFQKEWLLAGLNYFDFVSLYDHPDKYTTLYNKLERTIVSSEIGHFATAPSTVMTFACSSKILNKASNTLLDNEFTGTNKKYPDDHKMFLRLCYDGYTLGTALPSRSTHCEKSFLAPFVDWQTYARSVNKLNIDEILFNNTNKKKW